MKRFLFISVSLLFLCSSASAGPPYTCVTNNYGVTMNPGSFQSGWEYTNTLKVDSVMQNDAGFNVSYHINFSAPDELDPDPDIGTYLSEINANAGAIFIFTHGNPEGQLVAYYAYNDSGKVHRDRDYTYYYGQLGPRVYKSESVGSYYAIGYRYAYITFAQGGAGDMAHGFWHNACCDGDQFTQLGGGEADRKPAVAAGESGCPSVSTIYSDVNTVWETVASDDIYWRSFENGISDAANLSLIGTGTAEGLVLFPKVMGFSHKSGTQVPPYGIDVTLETDTHMNTTAYPASWIAHASGDILVSSAWFASDTQLKVTLVPKPGVVNGEGWLEVSNWPASGTVYVELEGGKQQNFRFIVGDGPAAEVTGFSVEDGLASFDVASEHRTKHYVIEEALSAQGPWTAIGIPEPPYVGNHAIEVAGHGPLIRLVEVEADAPTGGPGRRIIHKYGRVGTKPVVTHRPEPSLAERKQKVAKRKADRLAQMAMQQETALTLPGTGKRGVIFSPGAAVPYLETYLADPVRIGLGYTVSVVSVDPFAVLGSDSLFAIALKAAIADSAAAGVEYIWLVGDDGDPLHSQVWPDSAWEAIRQEQLSSGYDPTGRAADVEIPAFAAWDLNPRGVSPYFHAPYGKTDLPYANVDDDSLGIRDIYLARLPFSDESRIVNYSYKLWNEMSSINGIASALLLDHDVDHDDPGDGAYADSVVTNVLLPIIPATGTVTVLRMSEIFDNGEDVNIRVADELNALRPNYLGGVSSLSHELFWMNMIDLTINPPWDMSLLNVNVSLCDLPSCGTAGFWRNGIPADGPGLATLWLGTWGVGATNVRGYGDGTWQRVDAKEDEYFLQEIAADPNQPACIASTKASNRLRADFSDKNEYLVVDETKFFLGNPFTPIAQEDIPTGIEDGATPRQMKLEQNYPNPFNPSTRIRYTLTKTGLVRINIFNVLGQQVRTLVNEVKPAGTYTKEWDGLNDAGNRVASGTYFYRISAEGRYLTKKMVLLK